MINKYLVNISVVVTAISEDEACELAQEKIGRGGWQDYNVKCLVKKE